MNISTLGNLDLSRLLRYSRKRIRHWIAFKKAQVRGIKSYPMTVDNVTIDLYFHTPYHHMRAKSWSEGEWEELPLLPLWKERAEHSNLIFDVGGYNGYYGMLAAKANPNAQVYIFEPDPINTEHIKINLRNNRIENALLFEFAASDKEGIAHFAGDGSTGGKLVEWGKFQVPTVILHAYGSPDLIKIDVEGHENAVIHGGDLSKTKWILVEDNGPLDLNGFTQILKVDITALYERVV